MKYGHTIFARDLLLSPSQTNNPNYPAGPFPTRDPWLPPILAPLKPIS